MSDHDTWNMFAAAALQGMCAYHGSYGLNNGPGEIAARAYDIADALLAESKERETPAATTPPQPDDDGVMVAPKGGSVRELLAHALSDLLQRDEINTCQHENTHRGGFLWTICDDCDAKFADDMNPWQPFVEPMEWTNARAALEAYHFVSEAGVTK